MQSFLRFVAPILSVSAVLIALPTAPALANPIHTCSHDCPADGDEDGDGIAYELDACPLVPGLAELRGCAPTFNDFDSDGVEDRLDLCPRTPFGAIVQPDGCSTFTDFFDDDVDGVPNGQDLCPMEPSWTSSGCPPYQEEDPDGDGIINLLDQCPYQFGPISRNGCPGYTSPPWDTDLDGIHNEQDQCPFTGDPGFALVGPNGCAHDRHLDDADQDGVSDADDLCPHSPLGHKVDAQGCTGTQAWQRQDDDGDGVNNALDLCPNTWLDPYFVQPMSRVTLYGCHVGELDSDFDGVPDPLDLCPWEPGHRLLHGCRHTPYSWHDADMDGASDMIDRCPFSRARTSGNPGFYGCQDDDLADFDGDGVINGQDLCPASPPGSLVDDQGCNDLDRLDFDQDGVMNGVDLCPHLSGLPSRNGCADNPFDADMDGVENRFDLCPYSLPFELVDERGCGMSPHVIDRDGDGVPDEHDQCRNTPTHQAADFSTGCSWQEQLAKEDEDKDGVGDRLDFCLGTPPNTPVDPRGCELPWHLRDDRDGDNVPDQFDLCPDTRRGVAITHDGCEIFDGLRVLSNVHRPFPRELPFVEIRDAEIDVKTFPQQPPMPLEFELHQTAMDQALPVMVYGDRLEIHIPPHMQDRPLRIPVRVRNLYTNQVSNWFEVIIGSSAGDTSVSASLIINDPQVLDMTGINLRAAFSLLSTWSAHPQPEMELFRQLWDSQRSTSSLNLPFFCTGEINGFPIVCDQPGTEIATLDDWSITMEMDNYRLTAVVNRLDLHNDWQDCGEHRLVFALQNSGVQRKFINLEARLPNPMPGDIQGCRPLIEFWRDMANLNGLDQAQRINQLFYGGLFIGTPAVAPQHFLAETGQIRTTQFWGDEWLFKEHKLEHYCSGFEPCRYWVRTVSVKENPFGHLFNPQNVMFDHPFRAIAEDFQQWFPQNLAGLLTNNPAQMHNRVAERFNHGQSHASGPNQFENDFLAHFSGQLWSPFAMDIQMAIQNHHNADGSPLTVENILARATATTCAGCHAPDSFLSNFRGQIGVLELPDGSRITEWPLSHDFVHINEQGELSPAMRDVFLPGRAVIFEGILNELEMM